VENNIKGIAEEISVLDARGESLGLSTSEVVVRKKLFEEYWKAQKIREASLFQ
jgi:hypothetical protein